MNETMLTVVGNLTEAPELRFLPSGVARAGFTVASTPRRFDTTTSAWVNSDPLFQRCVGWGSLAEHAAESLGKGDRVVVTGRLRQRPYETETGERRSVVELEVDDLGPSLRFATARPQRVSAGGRENAEDAAGDAAQADPEADGDGASASRERVSGHG